MGPKVLFTASTYSHILNFHLPYLRSFREEGWTVHVACGGKSAPIPYAEEILNLPFEKKMNALGNFRAAKLLRKKIEKEGYSLISTHTSLAAFFTRAALLGKKDRPAVANMVHGYLFDGDTPAWKRELLLTAERWMAARTDLLLTMNQWDFELAKKLRLGRRVAWVPGIGVDFSRFRERNPAEMEGCRRELGLPAEAFVLLYAAEFSQRKSQEVLIKAMQSLSECAVLILAGEGALRTQCQRLARELGVEDRVIFPGYVKDMSPWHQAADAAVSASRSEGLPFNVMEAMYVGLPVVASAVKGHEDLIRHEETGLLYPYGDAEACAAQIRALMDSLELCRALVEEGRRSVEQYGLERVLPLVMAEYETLLPVPAEAQRG